ncbi:MAG TPA: TetR family transcriptional regulator [Acidimicrobiia bacterium]
MARSSATAESRNDGEVPDPELLPAHLRRRRDRIVEAALDLLEDGAEYDRIQIRDVAQRAGVALGTLYRYFTSKEHLYAAVLLEWAKTFAFASERDDARAESDEARVRRRLHRAVRAFERRPQFLRAEILLESSNDDNARRLFARFADRHQDAMTAALVDTEPEEAAAIVETTSMVMAAKLRSWALGRTTIADVHATVDRTVDLVFSPRARFRHDAAS